MALAALTFLGVTPAMASARGESSYNAGWGGYSRDIAACDDGGGTTTCTTDHTYDVGEGAVSSMATATAVVPSTGSASSYPGLYKVWTNKAARSVTASFTVHVDKAEVARSAQLGTSVVVVEAFLEDFACTTSCLATNSALLATGDPTASTAVLDAGGNLTVDVTLQMAGGASLPAGKLRATLDLFSFAGSSTTPYAGTDSADGAIHVLNLSVS